jgi:hypothetical protein
MMLEILNNSEESDYCDPFLSKNLWSSGLVHAIVSVNVRRSFISCQTFRETGNVR